MKNKIYGCVDLKSFYASVECAERGLDPFKTNLVVADPSRGSGGICLAISPAMKNLGIKNRCRLFEIPKNVKYITALPRMKKYMEYSANIYSIYLKYMSKEDIYIYSIDECFFDFTPYLSSYGKTPREFAVMLMEAVMKNTGVCATAGIGTNLFLAKVALDITAKHVSDNIGFLDENEFKKTIWHHRPITDIWNVGRGIAKRLEKYGIQDLYGVAHMDESILYKEFGVNAEFLIYHSKGYEPCTIKEIHDYKPKTESISNGQILFNDYNFDDALIVLYEMVDQLVLELTQRKSKTNSISLYIRYSKECTASTGGTRKLNFRSSSYSKISAEFEKLYRETTKKNYPIRQINVGLNHIEEDEFQQLDLFDKVDDDKEIKVQKGIIEIKNKFGKNAVLRCSSLQDKATARIRNKLVGGHNGE